MKFKHSFLSFTFYSIYLVRPKLARLFSVRFNKEIEAEISISTKNESILFRNDSNEKIDL
jgi:hypothetical protein